MAERRRVLKISRTGVPVLRATRDAQSGHTTWLEDTAGHVVGAIVPAQNVHEDGKCCCKNCPWGGNHG